MGYRLICMTIKDVREIGSKKSKRRETGSSSSSQQQQHNLDAEEELMHKPQEAITPMEEEEVHHQKRLSQSLRFDTSSMSGGIRSKSICRTRRTLSDPFSNEKQLPDFMENMKMKKFVLIHGEGFGAWCWYQTIALLEEAGLLSIALDLKGSGIDQTDTDSVTTVADYAKPLIDYLHNLPEDDEERRKGEKITYSVILVGHSCGGAVVSYALECYPEKISKAVFVCATMVSDGQRPFDVFSEKLRSAEIFIKESPFLVYGNGRDNAPTSLMLHKQQMKGLYFNQTPVKDIALATHSMRAIPLGPIMETLSLSRTNYGKGRRFYIQTDVNDNILSSDIQHKLVKENPPEQVYKIKGCDHCPFFSKPQSLHRIFLEIARIP